MHKRIWLLALPLLFSCASPRVQGKPSSVPLHLDPSGDVSDHEEPFVDVVGERVVREDGAFVATVRLAGPVPPQLEDPDRFVEWDVLIDADRDRTTGWRPLAFSTPLGVDWLVRLSVQGTELKSGKLEIATRRWSDVVFQVDGDEIALRFELPGIEAFDYVVAVREFKGFAPQELVRYDRVPNTFYRSFPEPQDSDGDGVPDEVETTLFGTRTDVAERWDSLPEVTRILDTPDKVAGFLQRRFKSKRRPQQPFVVPVETLFRMMWGDCDEYARLAAYWLEKNGYEAYMAQVVFDRTSDGYQQHDIAIYKDRDGSWNALDIYFFGAGAKPVGPVASEQEACAEAPPHYGTALKECMLYDSAGKVVRTLTR